MARDGVVDGQQQQQRQQSGIRVVGAQTPSGTGSSRRQRIRQATATATTGPTGPTAIAAAGAAGLEVQDGNVPSVHREDQVRVRRQVSVRARRTGPAPRVPTPQVQDRTVPLVQLGRLLPVRSTVPFRAQGRRLHPTGVARLAAAVHVLVVRHRQRRRLAGRPRTGHARRHVHAAPVARGPVTGVQQAVRLAAGHR